jgi:hypothetical protein
VELYLHSPIRLHGVVLNEAQGQLYLSFRNRSVGKVTAYGKDDCSKVNVKLSLCSVFN